MNNIAQEFEKISIKDDDYCEIILKNKNGDVVGNTKIDKIVYDHIMNNNDNVKRNVGPDKDGYAGIIVNKIRYALSRYIYYEFYQNTMTEKTIIDHINNDRLDNRIENLREITYAQNAVNKTKKENATNEYYGVSKSSSKGSGGTPLWQCQLRSSEFRYNFSYSDPLHAAYHYDLLVKKHDMQEFAKLNNIEMPPDFIMKTEYVRKYDLPKHIRMTSNNKYYYNIRCTTSKRFDTLEEAEKQLAEFKIKIDNDKKETFLNTPIKRNINNNAVIELFSRDKNNIVETEVDDEDYYMLNQYKWNNFKGRVIGTVDGKTVLLSRFIMNYTGHDMVDHIDSNPLNNRKSNLRILTAAENAQNKSSLEGSSSKYVGVSYDKSRNKWFSFIQLNNKKEHIGRFNTEEEAARARDKRANELNNSELKTYFKLNFPIILQENNENDNNT